MVLRPPPRVIASAHVPKKVTLRYESLDFNLEPRLALPVLGTARRKGATGGTAVAQARDLRGRVVFCELILFRGGGVVGSRLY